MTTNVYKSAEYTPPPGCLGNLNESQQSAFNQLKAMLKVHFDQHRTEFKDDYEERFDDIRILRFLRARQFSVEKALEMIVSDINWRDALDLKHVMDTFPASPQFQQLLEYWPAHTYARDHFGVEAWWERIGLVDARSFIENVKHEDLLHFHIVCQEANEKRFFTQRSDGIFHQEGGTIVFDLSGLGWKHFNSAAMGLIKELSSIDEAHYPEMVRRIYITSAPSIFGMFYRMISPWLDKNTAEKIQVISHPKEILGAEFGIDVLPQFVGGTANPPIPKGGVFKSTLGPTATENPMSSIMVKDYFEIEISIDEVNDPNKNIYEVGSMVGWNFVVDSHDLGFVVYFIAKGTSDDERKMVHEYERSARHEGSFTTETPGKYIFHWDNSFSLFRKKSLQYQLFVEPPMTAAAEHDKMMVLSKKDKDDLRKKEKKDRKEREKKEKKDKKKDKKHASHHKRTLSSSSATK